MSIVRAKLQPPRQQADAIRRTHLLQRLGQLWSRPLGLVVAPAGFGKSTLARSWTDLRPDRVAWLTLDPSDNDVDRFISYVLGALESVAPGAVENTRSLAERSSRPTTRELAETMADELFDLEGDVCLVLDEAERLNAPEAWEFLECLIRLAPSRFHLLVLSRQDPPLPLARLRMREQVVELRGSDLLLTPAEIQELFAKGGIDIDDRLSRTILDETHGWPAGVRLALAQPLTTNDAWPRHERANEPPNGFLLDPLAEELVEHLPDSASEALLLASMVDDLKPDLLEAVLGLTCPAATFVAEFTRSGLLIRSAERGAPWVRLHPLFRDLFGRQLAAKRSRSQIETWHRGIARWFHSEGDVRSAVRHLLAAGESGEVVDLLHVEIPHAIDREDWASVAEWLDLLPPGLVAHAPVLALGRSWVLFFKGSWLAMRSARTELRALLDALPQDDPRREQWLAELSVLEALETTPLPGDIARALSQIEEAAPLIDPTRRFVVGHLEFKRVTALEDLGRSAEADAALAAAVGRAGTRVDSAVIRPLVAGCFVLRQRGALPQLAIAASEVSALAEAHDLPLARGWGRLFHAFVLFQRNDLAAAEPILSDLVADHHRVHIACLREGMLLLARTYWLQGDATESSAIVRRLREMLTSRGALELLPSITLFERFLAYLNNPDAVDPDSRPDMSDAIIDATPHLMHHPVTTAVLLNCAAGGTYAEQALELTEAFAARVAEVHFPCWQPEILALRAIALATLGRTDEAIESMRAALKPGVAKHLTRTLSDLGPRAHELYRALVNDEEIGAIARALVPASTRRSDGEIEPSPFISPTATPASRRRDNPLSALTDRELAVLALLERRLSYKEIGETLFISPLTVKRHAGNIYDKLGVDCRRDAVSTARELGWRGSSNPA